MTNNIPLYNKAKEAIESQPFQPEKTNAGLWYNKFFDNDSNDGTKKKTKDIINKISSKELGDKALINELVSRQKEMIKSLKGNYMFFKNTSRFLTGVGNSHPTEIGFTWHYILGTPYLPGSSVKGLVKNYVVNQKINGEDIKRIFGSVQSNDENKDDKKINKKNENIVGSVIFLDALPSKTVKLGGDIMTPHYNDYYQNNKYPTDDLQPIPLQFLVVEKGQEFLFGIIPRSPKTNENDVKLAKEWLEKALKTLGAGAKTSVGYGIFEPIDEVTEGDSWLNNLSKEKQLRPNVKNDINNMPQIVQEWEKISDIELKRSIAEAIKSRIEHLYNPEYWNNPPSGGKIKKAIEKLKNYLRA